ncbi:MAG TPA: hypothetical protein DCE41_03420, partial [Cytophagales bacterium]|nr:hypothetical protein [Cytophagales bacterium]
AATGYLSDGSPVEGKWVVYPEMAAAGLWTTPSELIMWAKEIQHIERNQQDGLLKVATVNEMLVRNEDDQGLGPVSARHYYGHGGADEGFRAELVVWKEAPVAVVMMVNSNRGNILLRELMISIAKEYDLPGYEPNIRTYNQQSEEQLAQYLGTYRFEEYGDAEMKLSEQGLEFSGEMFSSGSVYLLPESDTTFFNWDTGTYYNFRMEGGQVSGISVSNLWAEKVE